ncbi:uncharacterized protein [Lolium perenne]|uniref:uncharacterized protein n=1 Tax=Lolium perenne TaxID=4522 RepID=UPI0021F5E3D5|nr:uncharacterized protein LOC127348684 [Lolium perenne]
MRVVVEAAALRRMPSLEREPKTLSLHELNCAREAALYVLSTHSSQDAARIFTQGLKPVLVARSNSTDSDSDDDHDGDVFEPDGAFVDADHDGARRLRHPRGRIANKRDFATAPF